MMEKFPLAGSERARPTGARNIGPANPTERFEVTVLLAPMNADAMQARLARVENGDAVAPLSREDFAESHGASAADIEAVEKFAGAHHLRVASSDAARRTVILSGDVAAFEKAFSVKLDHYEHDAGNYRGREGAVMVPAALHGVVQAVLGLDNRPQAATHFRRPDHANPEKAAKAVSYTPLQVAQAYKFPPGTGAGQSIGFIELGGGIVQADFAAYFKGLGLDAPKLVSVPVDGATNAPTGSADGPDGEVMLDVEVAGAIAPEATLVVYFAPNTDAGFLNAVTTAIHDKTNRPTVISISWGGPESSWTAQSFAAFDQAFQDAAALGVTVCVASGDNGSSDNAGGNNVDFPASSPHVLACGGTSLREKGSAIGSEKVWNDGAQGGAGGGGISVAFTAVPAWQSGLSAALTSGGSTKLSGRGVPDVAGDADPETGYKVRVDGTDTVVGGTSAVAPLWAGLLTRLNGTRTIPVGFINPLLYKNAGAFHDITSGNNGTYAAGHGWDACTGMGSPNGPAIAALFATTGEAVS